MISKDACNMIRYLMIETDFAVIKNILGKGKQLSPVYQSLQSENLYIL